MNKQQILSLARSMSEHFVGPEPAILEDRAAKAAEFLAEEKKFAKMANDKTRGAEYRMYCAERARLARLRAYDEMGAPEIVEFMDHCTIKFPPV